MAQEIPSPTRVILDIETIGCVWEGMSGEEQEYLTTRAEWRCRETGDDPARFAATHLALAPLTGQVALIGMLNPDTKNARIYLCMPPVVVSDDVRMRDAALAAKAAIETATEKRVFVQLLETEEMLLRSFWHDVAKFQQIVTFNGRAFDGPFLMVRSLACGVSVTKDIVGNRYRDDHMDLADRLTFFGASRDRYTLDFWCRRLGIKSPKETMSGDAFERLWREGALEEVCRYNLDDLRATAELSDRYFHALGGIYHLRQNGRAAEQSGKPPPASEGTGNGT